MAFAAADCTNARSLCGRYGVTGYPTLRVFPKNADGSRSAKYSGSRKDAETMEKYLLENFSGDEEDLNGPVFADDHSPKKRNVGNKKNGNVDIDPDIATSVVDVDITTLIRVGVFSMYLGNAISLFSVSSYSKESAHAIAREYQSPFYIALVFAFHMTIAFVSCFDPVRWLRQCLWLGVTTNRCCLLTRALRNFLCSSPVLAYTHVSTLVTSSWWYSWFLWRRRSCDHERCCNCSWWRIGNMHCIFRLGHHVVVRTRTWCSSAKRWINHIPQISSPYHRNSFRSVCRVGWVHTFLTLDERKRSERRICIFYTYKYRIIRRFKNEPLRADTSLLVPLWATSNPKPSQKLNFRVCVSGSIWLRWYHATHDRLHFEQTQHPDLSVVFFTTRLNFFAKMSLQMSQQEDFQVSRDSTHSWLYRLSVESHASAILFNRARSRPQTFGCHELFRRCMARFLALIPGFNFARTPTTTPSSSITSYRIPVSSAFESWLHSDLPKAPNNLFSPSLPFEAIPSTSYLFLFYVVCSSEVDLLMSKILSVSSSSSSWKLPVFEYSSWSFSSWSWNLFSCSFSKPPS